MRVATPQAAEPYGFGPNHALACRSVIWTSGRSLSDAIKRISRLFTSAAILSSTALACVALSTAARADDYSLFNPVPDDSLRPFCTDRPTKNTGVCTIDAGHFQIESDIFNATFDRQDGVTTDTFLFTNPNLKLGLTDNTDIELNFAPYEVESVTERGSRSEDSFSGFGDMFLHLKVNFAGNSGGDFGIAIDPYLKAPTASDHLGNGSVEGGLPVPMSFAINSALQLSVTPELDILKDAASDGHHAQFQMPVGLTYSISSTVTLSGEVWGAFNNDPLDETNQYSADFAATWQPPGTKDLQLDVGANFGLNKNTPGTQVYAGISKRW